MHIGNQIAIMQNNKIIQINTPNKILNNPTNNYIHTFFHNININQIFNTKNITHQTPNNLIHKTPNFNPHSTLKLLQNKNHKYNYIIKHNNKFINTISINSLKTTLTQQQNLNTTLINTPLTINTQTPLNKLLSHIKQTPYTIPIINKNQQYINIISKKILLHTLNHKKINNN